MYLAHTDAIDHAEWIVVAEPIQREKRDGKRDNQGRPSQGLVYRMRAIEYVKGNGPKEFIVHHAQQEAANGDSHLPAEANYYGHSTSSFWSFGGRYFNWPDCRIHPGFFFSGQKYLIFGPLDYNVGFENITDENDLWLEYVKNRVASGTPKTPFPKTIEDYLTTAEAVVRVKARWDGTSSKWQQEIISGPDENYMNLVYASPSAAFDAALHQDCQGFSSENTRPDYLDRLYVFERIPKEKNVTKNNSLDCAGGDLRSDVNISAYGRFSLSGYRIFDIKKGRVAFPENAAFHKTKIAATDAGSVSVMKLRRMLKRD